MQDGPYSDDSGSPAGDSPHGNGLILVVFCLAVVALLAGGVSLLVHHVIKGPVSPYQVGFSSVGEACEKDSDSDFKGFILSRSTGEILYCGAVPGYATDPAGSPGDFSGEETARVVGLAKSLAAEGGLSGADEDAVGRLAEEIGRKHGYEPLTLTARITGSAGPWGLGLGVLLLVGLGVWGHCGENP